jgi:hypothetical protein
MDLAGRYMLSRDDVRFGPYTLDQLRDFRRRGNVVDSDWAWTDGMSEWISVGQLLDGPPGEPAPADGTVPEAATRPPFGTFEPVAPSPGGVAPPPSLHWGLVLLFSVITCGIFSMAWMFVQAVWVKKVDPESRAIPVLAVGVAFGVAFAVAAARAQGEAKEALNMLGNLAQVVAFVTAYFSMRSSLEGYFNEDEPIGLRLNGLMTFFFGLFYFQYHFTRIARWKTTGVLDRY